jgi:phenylpyruvate tautomerase PptA (4-oxalocrotonate tautomerase family)
MPVVRIRALPQAEGTDEAGVAAAVARELAELLAEPEDRSWVIWDTIEPGRYAEGSTAPETQPRSTHPPLVTVSALSGRTPDLIERMLEQVANTLTRELGLQAGNVYATYEEIRRGRVYTNGRVIR